MDLSELSKGTSKETNVSQDVEMNRENPEEYGYGRKEKKDEYQHGFSVTEKVSKMLIVVINSQSTSSVSIADAMSGNFKWKKPESIVTISFSSVRI